MGAMEAQIGVTTAGMEEGLSREQNDRGWQGTVRVNPEAGTAVGLRDQVGENGKRRRRRAARLRRRPRQILGDGIRLSIRNDTMNVIRCQ